MPNNGNMYDYGELLKIHEHSIQIDNFQQYIQVLAHVDTCDK